MLKATLSSRLWPSASLFYRTVLRWVYIPEASSVEEDAQFAQRTVSSCLPELLFAGGRGCHFQPLFRFPWEILRTLSFFSLCCPGFLKCTFYVVGFCASWPRNKVKTGSIHGGEIFSLLRRENARFQEAAVGALAAVALFANGRAPERSQMAGLICLIWRFSNSH